MTRQFSYQFHTLVFNQPIYACGFGDERCLESLVFLVLNRIIFNFPLKRRNFLICCFYFNFVCSFPPCYKQQSDRRFVAPSRPRIFFPRNEVRHPSSKSTLKLVLGYKVSAWLQIYTDKCPGGWGIAISKKYQLVYFLISSWRTGGIIQKKTLEDVSRVKLEARANRLSQSTYQRRKWNNWSKSKSPLKPIEVDESK